LDCPCAKPLKFEKFIQAWWLRSKLKGYGHAEITTERGES
jgi:hypothetical protein